MNIFRRLRDGQEVEQLTAHTYIVGNENNLRVFLILSLGLKSVGIRHLCVDVPSYCVLTMDFDEILSLVGDFSRYQKRLLVFLCIPVVLSSVTIYNHAFISAVPEHHCSLSIPTERADLFIKSLEATEVCPYTPHGFLTTRDRLLHRLSEEVLLMAEN